MFEGAVLGHGCFHPLDLPLVETQVGHHSPQEHQHHYDQHYPEELSVFYGDRFVLPLVPETDGVEGGSTVYVIEGHQRFVDMEDLVIGVESLVGLLKDELLQITLLVLQEHVLLDLISLGSQSKQDHQVLLVPQGVVSEVSDAELVEVFLLVELCGTHPFAPLFLLPWLQAGVHLDDLEDVLLVRQDLEHFVR